MQKNSQINNNQTFREMKCDSESRDLHHTKNTKDYTYGRIVDGFLPLVIGIRNNTSQE